MTGPRPLSGLLRRHRHDADLTLEKLSETSGVSVRAISNMERGHSLGPQSATIDLLASSLRLDPHHRAELLAAARAGRRGTSPAPRAVLAMPRRVTDFVGRTAEMRYLAGLAKAERSGPAAVVIVSGTPGVGKTSFAVHAAAELAQAFPDGQLFLDLAGLDERPPAPSTILRRLINALAPELATVPQDQDERAGLYRTLLVRRRMVIVLDNAADESQVRMLLPGDGPSMTIITSRRRLSGLDTAHRLSLVPLTQTYAVQMLSNIVGARPGTDSPLEHLAELSGNLPLALRLIGNRLSSHPDTSSARFAQRLGVEEHRLEILTAGDLRISAVFTSSYVQLSADAQRLFRRLALIPAHDTGPAMAAILADLPLQRTEMALDELVEFGLLQTGFTDRYRLHDLLRLFARSQLDSTEAPLDITGTRDRVQEWLLTSATVAGQRCEPDFTSLPADRDHRVPMQTVALARQWLVTEADN